MNTYCFSLDLIDDPDLIAEYENYHRSENAWPEIMNSIREAGILDLQIFRTGNRLFMLMKTDDTFSFERKAAMDAANSKVQEWEQLMWKFQRALPWAKEGEKWILMDRIFKL